MTMGRKRRSSKNSASRRSSGKPSISQAALPRAPTTAAFVATESWATARRRLRDRLRRSLFNKLAYLVVLLGLAATGLTLALLLGFRGVGLILPTLGGGMAVAAPLIGAKVSDTWATRTLGLLAGFGGRERRSGTRLLYVAALTALMVGLLVGSRFVPATYGGWMLLLWALSGCWLLWYLSQQCRRNRLLKGLLASAAGWLAGVSGNYFTGLTMDADLRGVIDQSLQPLMARLDELLGIQRSTQTLVQETHDIVAGIATQQVEERAKFDQFGVQLSEIVELERREKLSEDELRARLTAEIEQEYAEKLQFERDAHEAAERAAAAVLAIKDDADIARALREQGPRAVVDALLKHLAASEQKTIELHRQIAQWALFVGDIGQAERSVEAILANNPDDLDGLNASGQVHFLRGELSEAEALWRRLLYLAADAGPVAAAAYTNLSQICKMRGDLTQSEAMLRKALAIDEKRGYREGMAVQYANLGMICRRRGELTQAEALLRKALAINEELGRREGIANQYGNLGLIYQARGDLTQAETMIRKSLAIEEELGHREGMVSDYGNLGLIYQTRGDLAQAEAMIRKALAIADELGYREGIANAYANLGAISEQRGDLRQARTHWEKARDLFAQIGMQPELEGVERSLRDLPTQSPASDAP